MSDNNHDGANKKTASLAFGDGDGRRRRGRRRLLGRRRRRRRRRLFLLLRRRRFLTQFQVAQLRRQGADKAFFLKKKRFNL